MNHSAASFKKSKKKGLINGYRNYFGIPIDGEPDYPDDIAYGTWTNVPAGYLSSSISDMGRYLQMHLNDGENIISKESINSMFLIMCLLMMVPIITAWDGSIQPKCIVSQCFGTLD